MQLNLGEKTTILVMGFTTIGLTLAIAAYKLQAKPYSDDGNCAAKSVEYLKTMHEFIALYQGSCKEGQVNCFPAFVDIGDCVALNVAPKAAGSAMRLTNLKLDMLQACSRSGEISYAACDAAATGAANPKAIE